MKIISKTVIVTLLILSGIILKFCKEEEVPVVATSDVTTITANTAASGGNITSDGGAGVTGRGVCWSANANPTISDSKTNDGNGIGQFVSTLGGLNAGLTYHVRAYASNSAGTAYGTDLSFSTLGHGPEAQTQSATNITATGATLNASVNANYLSTTVTFEYGVDMNYGQTITANQSPITGNTITLVTAPISGLVLGTTCHFRVKVVNELGTAYGNDLTFTTSSIVLPPSESMIIDFSNFTSEKKSAGLKGTETSTWEFAAAVSEVWSSFITSNLEIPITAFRFAADHEPTFLEDTTYQWSYNFSVNSSSYKARLTGKIRTNDVYWEMYITKEETGGFADFLWFKGTSSSNGLEGQWVFKQSPASPVQMFCNDWTKTETLISSVKYTYLKNDTNLNSYILYGLTTGSSKASYEIHFTNGFYSDADIDWNTTDLNGRLKCTDYLHDNNWHCWNSNKINVICP
jgi:hypothetical protein